ncbi:MAG: inosine/xanthosine triphosphatase [bacterium]
MQIAVGSTNPVKVMAVEEAFKRYYPDCKVNGVEVKSGVAEQPRGEQETMDGARNRSKAALGDNAFGVGLEGGVCEIEGKMFECAWVCVVQKSQITNSQILKSDYIEGLGGGLYFELPDKIVEKIRAGGELGPIMNEMTGEDNVKQKMGAIGIFTKGQLDRKNAYVQLVLSAMVKFVSPEWFVS